MGESASYSDRGSYADLSVLRDQPVEGDVVRSCVILLYMDVVCTSG